MANILVIPSYPKLLNAGDAAMLQVALTRIGRRWPDSRLQVLANGEKQLARCYPSAEYVPSTPWDLWFSSPFGRFSRTLPASSSTGLERMVRYHVPVVGRFLLARRARRAAVDCADLTALQDTLAQVDMVVAAGGGYLNDMFPQYAHTVLRCLEWATRKHKPVLLFGQGIGPLTDGHLRTTIRQILRAVDMIGLREARASLPLLGELGVPGDRIFTTGDDAIELAYCRRPEASGAAIGVNLRKARYSGLEDAQIAVIGKAIRAAATQLDAPLLPIPISSVAHDATVIAQLMPAPAADAPGERDSSLAAITQVGRCRVVFTGSYHAGVFALAQGIPVVSVAKTRYYFDKFYGLADQFGGGCTVLSLDDHRLYPAIVDALVSAWYAADETRARLLAAARRQIDAGHRAYERAFAVAEAAMNGH
jgi:polysaccharide pyruvyl transferase WcaK-like protein